MLSADTLVRYLHNAKRLEFKCHAFQFETADLSADTQLRKDKFQSMQLSDLAMTLLDIYEEPKGALLAVGAP